MTAPNTETTTLTRNLGDGNPDGLVFQGVKTTALTVSTSATLTANQMVNGVFTFGNSGNMTLTTDTAANIIAQVGYGTLRAEPANSFFYTTIAMTAANWGGANAATMAGGTGVNLTGNLLMGNIANAAQFSLTYMFVINSNGTVTGYRTN
jgi:hypothetical protein